MLKKHQHRLLNVLATLLFLGCLHSASLDEAHMSNRLQLALSALSSHMLDIREALTRCSRNDAEESRLCSRYQPLETRASGGNDDVEERR
ncbi:hypothetical protein ACQKDS_16180 [Serratia sp. NPDC078593]|uniref:hypothetical protein n=1 Tax=unclassified Serratia (in: enterobacteria) TaxID=2647522 RepID=UPI0037CE957B